MRLPGHDRYGYVPITRPADWSWPGGKRLAFYVGLNVEHFAFGTGLGAELAPGGGPPDVLNFAWRDYGNRVGIWRLIELLDELGLPATALLNAAISESLVTPDLLDEAGYRYLLDWCHDDRPVWLRTRRGRILSVPYPQELNDIPAIVARRMNAAAFADMIVDQADEMLRQCRDQPLVMGLAVHGYILGQPHRLKHLRRALRHVLEAGGERLWLTTAGAIADHVAGLPSGAVP